MMRALNSSDIEQVWKITQSAEFHGPWSRESLFQEIEYAHSWSQWEGGRLVAFILFRELPEQIEISWLATAPEDQGRGHMTELLQSLHAANSHKLEVWLEVHEDNLSAQKLYEKLGFVRTGLRPRYYGGQKAAFLYSKSLQN